MMVIYGVNNDLSTLLFGRKCVLLIKSEHTSIER